jgi:hypothetical protein
MRPKPLRDLPYLVHTNRELGLMLRGQKPMACFMEFPEAMPRCLARYLRIFDGYVARGRFTKRVHVRTVADGGPPHKELHEIFYTLPGEEWRAQAKIDLYGLPGKWSAARERRLGELLGYADWQNDIWMSGFRETDSTGDR